MCKEKTTALYALHACYVLHVSTSCCFEQNDNVEKPNLTFCDEPQYTRFSSTYQALASAVNTSFILALNYLRG